MSSMSLKLEGVTDLLAYYADLKGVPYEKVVRNACKDIVYGAYQATPIASKSGKSPWALLPGRGTLEGKLIFLNLEVQDDRTAKRLAPFRLAPIHRGFALSAFIPAMKALGFQNSKPPGAMSEEKSRGLRIFVNSSKYRPLNKKLSKGDDGFKEGLEGVRKQISRSIPSLGAAVERISRFYPEIEVTVIEPSLDGKYPDWSQKAYEAGTKNAAVSILRDLSRIFGSKSPRKEKIERMH